MNNEPEAKKYSRGVANLKKKLSKLNKAKKNVGQAVVDDGAAVGPRALARRRALVAGLAVVRPGPLRGLLRGGRHLRRAHGAFGVRGALRPRWVRQPGRSLLGSRSVPGAGSASV